MALPCNDMSAVCTFEKESAQVLNRCEIGAKRVRNMRTLPNGGEGRGRRRRAEQRSGQEPMLNY